MSLSPFNLGVHTLVCISVAPLLVPVLPLPEESVIVVESNFHQATGEPDIAVCGVPLL